MINFYKSTDSLNKYIEALEQRRNELHQELRFIEAGLSVHRGKVLKLDWTQDADALVTVFKGISFRIEYDQELKDEHRPPYLAFYKDEFFDYFDTLEYAEKDLIKKAKRELWRKTKREHHLPRLQ